MARRIIKFPLKMSNGAEVRSLEELKANADVESIMKYYFNGQLSLWCRAFGYDDISANISETKEIFVKSVMDSIGLDVSANEIQEYIENSFGIFDNSRSTVDIENEEEIIDNDDIKNKLKDYIDTSVNLDDYEISVVPAENDNGKIEKYRISVSCEKAEQYTRFSLPYNITACYTKEQFERDLYRKIINCIKRLNEEIKYNSSCFATLNVGETLFMGRYEGKPIEWKIIYKQENELYVISKETLFKRKFSDFTSDWNECELRKWLNNDFYNSAFTANEKIYITNAVVYYMISQEYSSGNYTMFLRDFRGDDFELSEESDHIGIMYHGEGSVLDSKLLSNGTEWVYKGAWNHGCFSINGHDCGYLCIQAGEKIDFNGMHHPSEIFGIRPVFWLKY